MKVKGIMAAIVAIAAGANAYAQSAVSGHSASTVPEQINQDELIEKTELLYFGNGSVTDSSKHRDLINQFYEDQFRHSQDPRAPYFMLLSRNGNIAMGVGGDLKMLGSYDWDGSISGPAFSPYNISMAKDPAARNLLQFTPNRTALFFSIFGNDSRIGKFQVYVQGKFNGPGNTFKLGKAYATVGDWTFGYNKSTFDDPIAQPATVDTEGPNSEIDDSRILVRYMHNVTKAVSFAVSVEGPDSKIPSAASYKPITESVPDFGAFLQYAASKQHIRLSGIVRSLGYRNLVSATNHHEVGWGLNLSARLRPVDPLVVYASVNTGQGIGNFVNDLSCGSNDLLGSLSDPGKMYAPRSYGWYGALQYYFTPKVFSTVIFSQERILPKDHSDYGASEYKYGLYGTANVFWNIDPRVQVGAEFNIGKRCNIDGADRMAYRAAVSAEFSF